MKKVNLVRGIMLMFMLAFSIGASAKYKVGEIYDKDGLKGLIIYVDDSGQHGLLMSLDCSGDEWLDTSDNKYSTNAFYEDDGEKNMEVIAKFIEENNLSWDVFPLFKWARSLGDGWYIPALDELKKLILAINGDENKFKSGNCKKVHKLLKKEGGEGLFYKMMGRTDYKTLPCMYTSTEGDNGYVYQMHCAGLFKVKFDYVLSMKTNALSGKMTVRSRAVHKF